MTPLAWAGFAASVTLAAFLRGFTGFGFSLVAVPLLSLVAAPAEVVPVAVMLQLSISVAGLRDSLRLADWRSVGLLAAAAAVATPVGIAILVALSAAQARVAIAVLLLLAVALLGRGWRFARRLSVAATLAVGAVCGLFNGLAGIPGPPVVAFFVASGVPSAIARASMIVLFLLTAVFAASGLVVAGLLGPAALVPIVAGLPLVFAGSLAGAALFRRSGGRHYDRIALGVLAVTALATLLRSLPGL